MNKNKIMLKRFNRNNRKEKGKGNIHILKK